MNSDDLLLEEDDLPPLLLPDEEHADSVTEDSADAPESSSAESPDEGSAEEKTPKKRRTLKIILAVLAALILAGAGAGCYMWLNRELPADVSVHVNAGAIGLPAEEEEPAIDVDLRGDPVTPEEALQALTDAGAQKVYCTLTLGGLEFDSMAEEMDLTDGGDVTVDEVRDAVSVMPRLQEVVFPKASACAYEDISALNDELENIRVIWWLNVGGWYQIRTDTTAFCKNAVGMMVPMSNEDLQVLQYCHDMVTLDLGHSSLTDIAFLRNMPDLKYLIIADCDVENFSPLADMKNLYYLEAFMSDFDDLDFLKEMPALRYLNIGYSTVADPSALWELTGLEYLWFPGNSMSMEDLTSLQEALPDTKCYVPYVDVNGSTGGGWRNSQAYYDMRDSLGMAYLTA